MDCGSVAKRDCGCNFCNGRTGAQHDEGNARSLDKIGEPSHAAERAVASILNRLDAERWTNCPAASNISTIRVDLSGSPRVWRGRSQIDRKSTRLNSSH